MFNVIPDILLIVVAVVEDVVVVVVDDVFVFVVNVVVVVVVVIVIVIVVVILVINVVHILNAVVVVLVVVVVVVVVVLVVVYAFEHQFFILRIKSHDAIRSVEPPVHQPRTKFSSIVIQSISQPAHQKDRNERAGEEICSAKSWVALIGKKESKNEIKIGK